MPCDEQKFGMSSFDFCCSRNSANSANSREAPRKLEPWSLQIQNGLPRQAMKRLKQAIKADEVRSETASK